jgi:hypothetical protein
MSNWGWDDEMGDGGLANERGGRSGGGGGR